MEAAEGQQRGGVNAVEVAGRLLRLLTEAAGPMRLADIARAAGMPSAKAHRYMVSLGRAGLVEQDAATARYGLGPLLRRAGLAALGRSDDLARAQRVLETVASRSGETAVAVVWGSAGPTHVRLAAARHAAAALMPPGHVCPVTYSASGLVFCAFGDAAQVRPLALREMAQGRAIGRRGVPLTAADLDRTVAAVRVQGFAATDDEGDTGLTALSLPVMQGGGLRMALTVFSRAGRLDIAPGGPIVALLRDAVHSLAADLA